MTPKPKIIISNVHHSEDCLWCDTTQKSYHIGEEAANREHSNESEGISYD